VHGDAAYSMTCNDIWGQFADAIDTDTARAAWNQQCRLLSAGTCQQEAGLGVMVQDILNPLSKLKLSLGGSS
jgi:hypothetical protein